ncbi:unnamed protein product [Spirodela intermedia]|uniref:CRAL-TRIO domain-containing protein n=1 Tax=Spirodela intermedia TaxID=51605 RepID=A0A7I8JKQ0_SPIIN|nr:unnamed protein product [Spirodela intermedia]CAA6670708.1 unnamed protein product [Spirodela intermedia]
MGSGSLEAVKQLRALMEKALLSFTPLFFNSIFPLPFPLRQSTRTSSALSSCLSSLQNVHQGYPDETLVRFLKARDWNLVDCLRWRVDNEIDNILALISTELLRDTQLVGVSGYSKKGQPVFAIGAGLSTFDRASVHYYLQSHIQINEYRDRVPTATKKRGDYVGTCLKVLDMTGLRISALSQIKLLTIISTVDDLNYPEKTETYYIVNAPYVFSACWKVVKPLLQERTRRKIQVLQGCGRDELLKVMDYSSLPHFCLREGSGSSRHSATGTESCYSLDHDFHQQLYTYIREQSLMQNPVAPISQGSFHVDVPGSGTEESEIVQSIECELQKCGYQNGINHSIEAIKISD